MLRDTGDKHDYYEYIKKDKYIKPYFDLDCKITEKSGVVFDDKDAIFQEALEFISKEFGCKKMPDGWKNMPYTQNKEKTNQSGIK